MCVVYLPERMYLFPTQWKKIRKSLIVEESHSTVFQGPGGDKTELSGAANKHVKIVAFLSSFLDLDVALVFTA